ncbi:UNVERIFIED_CONTAM: hypothetical protein PYX00_006794 [Menopon gallinae]|uniref:Reverse transcriptase n=1 Tax=Menopon gallinae TaxID=328185 RepID=A0AAW2HWT2_9NEOP
MGADRVGEKVSSAQTYKLSEEDGHRHLPRLQDGFDGRNYGLVQDDSSGPAYSGSREEEEEGRIQQKGTRTRRLIPNLTGWFERKHGGVDSCVTQFLTGHGCFGTYLVRVKKREESRCPRCPGSEDSPEHVWDECPLWDEERETLRRKLGKRVPYWNLVEMLRNASQWGTIAATMNRIIYKKQLLP